MNNSKHKVFQVLAKSKPEITLVKHINDCLNILQQMPYCFSRLPFQNVLTFWKVLHDAVVFHDTGKSHADFQRILYGISSNSNNWKNQRHELFSLYYIYQSSLEEEDKRLLYYLVAGHHKHQEYILQHIDQMYDVEYSGFDYTGGTLSYSQECDKLWKKKTWKILACYGLKKESNDVIPLLDVLRDVYKNPVSADDNNYIRNLLMVGMLKQCDHLASAGVTRLYKLSDADFSFLFKFTHYTHQQKCYNSQGNIILTSPTGSGKTESSLLWLKHQLEVQGEGRIFYVLPYTASINAMYERMNAQFGSEEHFVGMLHGKLSQYLEEKFTDNEDYDSSIIESSLIRDFTTLVTPLKIVTPFQLLKHIFGVKGFEKGIAEWSGAYFIFDEIHAYDSITFAQIIVLLEFCIKKLGVNVFIMTATLPSFMLLKLQKAIGTSTHIIAEKSLYNTFDRHKLIIESNKLSESIDAIQDDLNAGKKVLVVCNTVEEAQTVYSVLNADSKLLIHGSFNAEDRSRKELKLRDEYVQLLVGTQAIEVSLDIDYDTIYSEPAPLDALIQRFGRVNRNRTKGICLCHVFEDSNDKDKFIYDQVIVKRTLSVLRENVMRKSDGIIHEQYLQRLIDLVYPYWEEKQQENFDKTYINLSQGLLKELSPLGYNHQSEEVFYKQFNGIKVLPVRFWEQYRKYIEEKRFIKADALMVSIHESRYYELLKDGSIEKDTLIFENDIDKYSKLVQKQVLVLKKQYDSEIGLQINKFDHSTDTFI